MKRLTCWAVELATMLAFMAGCNPAFAQFGTQGSYPDTTNSYWGIPAHPIGTIAGITGYFTNLMLNGVALPTNPLTNGALYATSAQGAKADTALQSEADTNALAQLAIETAALTNADYVLTTGKVDRVDTNGWEVSSHAGFATGTPVYAESDPIASSNLTAHVTNTVPHVSAGDRTNWNGKTTLADVAGVGYLPLVAGGANQLQGDLNVGGFDIVNYNTLLGLNAGYNPLGIGNAMIGYDGDCLGTDASIAIGETCASSGDHGSIAIGLVSVSSGSNGCVAIGDSATASGEGAIAIGRNTIASGDHAIAMGYAGLSSNMFSFVWGSGNNYGSKGAQTFAIDPLGGLVGFYIGETNLSTYLAGYVSTNDTRYLLALTNLTGAAIAAAGGLTNIVDTPYQPYTSTGTVTSGTCTVTFASGSLVYLTATASPTTLTFDNTNYLTNGVSRVAVELIAGTNSIAFATATITNSTAPTISTSTWTRLIFRRSGNDAAWIGGQVK